MSRTPSPPPVRSPPVAAAESSTLVSVSFDPRPVAYGYDANIFRGQWKGQNIALKQLRAHHPDLNKTLQVRLFFLGGVHILTPVTFPFRTAAL